MRRHYEGPDAKLYATATTEATALLTALRVQDIRPPEQHGPRQPGIDVR
jgi:hypothetical protein